MPVEKSAGVIIFRKKNHENLFLLLHYEGGHWGFPKGHIEEGETIKETAIREAKEETTITDLNFKEGFKEWIKYFYKREGKKFFKIVTYFLAETKQEEVEISHEHVGYKWLPYEQALKQVTFDNAKQILKAAHQFLKKEESNSK
ncbi:MAG: bis(5'-nucleosyl)-tetraphosphatase [Candidatus Paceibacterota bacterium]